MIGCPPDWRLEKHVKIGDIEYDICVTRRGSGFRATWICKHCDERAAFDPVGESVDEAVEAATIGVRVHQEIVHGSQIPSVP